jgi:hypothetical protein
MASERVKSFWPRTCQQNAATWMCLPSSASGISAVSELGHRLEVALRDYAAAKQEVEK